VSSATNKSATTRAAVGLRKTE